MDAWGDESIRSVSNPPIYLLTASYATAEGSIDIAPLKSIKSKKASKLHWRDMGNRTKARSAASIASLDVAH